MVLNLHPLGQLRDPGPGTLRKALQSQHELVLLRLESCIPGGLLTEIQKATDLVAQLC